MPEGRTGSANLDRQLQTLRDRMAKAEKENIKLKQELAALTARVKTLEDA